MVMRIPSSLGGATAIGSTAGNAVKRSCGRARSASRRTADGPAGAAGFTYRKGIPGVAPTFQPGRPVPAGTVEVVDVAAALTLISMIIYLRRALPVATADDDAS